MHRIIYLISIFVFSGLALSAQVCTPDTAANDPGIYPNSSTGIAPAQEGLPYSQTITAVVPVDTVIIIGGSPQTVVFDSIVLTALLGLPSWLSIQCSPPSCGIKGGEKGCAIVTGTAPSGSAGVYNIDVVTTSYGKIQGFSLPPQTDTAKSYYTLQVFPGTGVQEIESSTLFIVEQNPAKNNINIQIMLRKNEAASGELKLINLLGQVLMEQTVHLKQGKNKLEMNISNLPEGYYIIEFIQGDLRLTQKVVVSR